MVRPKINPLCLRQRLVGKLAKRLPPPTAKSDSGKRVNKSDRMPPRSTAFKAASQVASKIVCAIAWTVIMTLRRMRLRRLTQPISKRNGLSCQGVLEYVQFRPNI